MMLFIEMGTPCIIEFDDDEFGILMVDTITEKPVIIDRDLTWSTSYGKKDVFAFGGSSDVSSTMYDVIFIIEKKYFKKI